MPTRKQQLLEEKDGSFPLGCSVTLMRGNARNPGGVGEEALLTSPYVTSKATHPYSKLANRTQSQHLVCKLL